MRVTLTLPTIPIGRDIGDGRVIAADGDIEYPEVVPVRRGDQGTYDHPIAGFAQYSRNLEGQLTAEFTVDENVAEGLHSGRLVARPEFDFEDWEQYPEITVSVLTKGRLRGFTILRKG
jgi:hypothetical protein